MRWRQRTSPALLPPRTRTDRLLTAVVSSLLYVLDVAVTETQDARKHWRCWRAKHWMSQAGQPNGPICGRCGTTWPWRD
jgi:hypothetical protein